MVADCFRLYAGYDGGERRWVSLFDSLQAAEMFEQPASCAFTYAGDFEKFRGAVAHLAAFAMEGHGEAMGSFS